MIGQAFGNFQIMEQIGRGGMGVVYKAEDRHLQRTVALKFLPPELTRDSEAKQRFLREARAVSRIDHPNICTVHQIEETGDQQLFMVMPCYSGETLKARIARGPLPVLEAVAIAFQVACGLHRAHQSGIIHRDIKPGNIMITRHGEVKILDFGLAVFMDQPPAGDDDTVMGTVNYMSPEQARGEAVDHRSDIWSLGVVLYEMLTGQAPFHGDSAPAIFYSIMKNEPAPAAGLRPDLPPELAGVLERCLAKNPDQRYANLYQFLLELQAMGGGTLSLTIPAGATAPVRRDLDDDDTAPMRLIRRVRRPLAWTGAALVILFCVALAIPASRQRMRRWAGISDLPSVRSLIIIPFQAPAGDDHTKAFARGLSSILTIKLEQLEPPGETFWVVPLSDWLTNPPANAREALRIHSTNLALSGELTRAGESLRLNLRLLSGADGRLLASCQLQGHLSSLSTFQDRLPLAVADMLELDLEQPERGLLKKGDTALPGAFVSLTRARGWLNAFQDPASVEKALDLGKQAIEQDPACGQAQAIVLESLWRQHQLTGQSSRLAEAGEYWQKTFRNWQAYRPSRMIVARIMESRGDLPAAIAALQQLIRDCPRYYEARRRLALFFLSAGKPDEIKQSVELMTQVTQLRKTYWVSFSNRGYVLLHLGRYQEAEKDFQQAGRLAPGNPLPWSNLAYMYRNLGKKDEAIRCFTEAIALLPNYISYINLGGIYFDLQRYQESADCFSKSLKFRISDEEYATGLGNLAESYRQLPGREEDARQALTEVTGRLERLMEQFPDDPAFRGRRALYLAMSGHTEQALAEIENARRGRPNDLVLLVKAIRVRELAGQRAEALEALAAYLARFGQLAEIQADPDLAGLRQDSRYKQLIEESGKQYR